MLLLRGEKIPALGLVHVLLNTFAVFIKCGEIVLPVAVAVLGGALLIHHGTSEGAPRRRPAKTGGAS